MTLTNPSVLTIGDLARKFNCPAWQVRRLFERGLLPPATRVGPYRVVAASDLPPVNYGPACGASAGDVAGLR
jgi:hypothetical protein